MGSGTYDLRPAPSDAAAVDALLRECGARFAAEPQPLLLWADLRRACAAAGLRFEGDRCNGAVPGAQALVASPHDRRRYRILLVEEDTAVELRDPPPRPDPARVAADESFTYRQEAAR